MIDLTKYRFTLRPEVAAAMNDPSNDHSDILEAEAMRLKDAIATLEAFATRYTGGTHREFYAALIELAARAISDAAHVYQTYEPQQPVCPLCVAAHDVKIRSHELQEADDKPGTGRAGEGRCARSQRR
jgi:hypothetical protein